MMKTIEGIIPFGFSQGTGATVIIAPFTSGKEGNERGVLPEKPMSMSTESMSVRPRYPLKTNWKFTLGEEMG